ncbi:MAG: CopG family transcriptional regulator, partial [Thermosphaera sp.]|nr:CopG family transcriptional regulator [Thermosphaera sp.]
MRKSRKTIGVEAEYVELLKQIAVSRGMSIASYLKRLIEESVKIEEMGYFAPRALSERRIELILSKLGFTIIPWDITSEATSDEIALERGLVIGKTLRELGLNPVEVIELIG